MKRKLSLLFLILFSILISKTSNAQEMLIELPLSQQIEKSSLVIEGKVISKRSFWNTSDGLIYTANTVEVYKVFKGNPLATIEVITLGGTVGLKALIAHPSLKLQKGDIGVFTLVESDKVKTESKSATQIFKPYGSVQGFYKYNLYNDLAVNPFNKKQGIKSTFYNEILGLTKRDYSIISSFDIQEIHSKRMQNQAKGLLPPGSLTLDKSVVTAGTKDVLTITGTDFGATQGTVWFSNADDGGGTYINALDTQVLTWGDTEITVEVPSGAGTGPIYVEDSSNGQSPLSSTLTVSYAESNVVFDPGSGDEAYQVQHIRANASGGYTWQMQTDFFNDTEHPGARADFESAFNEWICQTGINWTISGTATAVDMVGGSSDGTNVIRFDNGSELDTNVLGICYSWYSGCGGVTFDWFVSELDIVFDSETNWHFGSGLPGITEYDFYSVALHELGHGHQLGHVIDTAFDGDNMDDVMHYALSNSEQQRVLTADNITAASNVQSRSTGSAVCGQLVMTDASCPLSVEENELAKAITIFPNPARNEFNIKNNSLINLQKTVIYDLSGRLISQIDMSDSPRTKTIDLIGVSKGVYFVNIYSDNAMITKKLVVN
ncbi:T9SS type A sorting domain-containing protein [Sabulilitoribacter multivorans]|uniref:T9SS type A sorting domain-containing protein n=1 Tax=Flaviramulus multivorans TaxID=1304750 RepID=A0ABS9IHF0_9FLAO|nr:T9SS type A sorting domain-containing protein [Flaviramulus multivorans]MCF7559808.1 T9SS type A sorting domain-containing protein [Flaviramulus multivorans]